MADAQKGAAVLDEQIAAKPRVYTPKNWREKVRELWRKGLPPGDKTGWPSLDKYYTVSPGQFTVVTGWPGSGKSEWLDALLVNLSRQGWKFAVFSPENQPTELHIAKILEKLSGMPFGAGPTERMSLEVVADFEDEMEKSFAFVEGTSGALSAQDVIEAVEPHLGRWKDSPRGLVIDPWNELEHWRPQNMTETEYVSATLSAVRSWARANKVHVWIVAHPQKMRREDGKLPIPRPDMIAGCHDAATEVLTARGWIPHADVTVFDRVACFNPVTGLASYRRPSKTWQYDHDGEMVRLSSPSFDALMTPNHRMVVRPNWRRKPSVASRLVMSGAGRPTAYALGEAWSFITADAIVDGLEMPWAPTFSDNDDDSDVMGFPSEDALRFLGWWISEGWFHKKSRGLGLCQADGPLANEMRKVLRRLGIKHSHRVDQPRGKGRLPIWRAYIWHSEFCEQVASDCGVGAVNKRLPQLAWGLSARQKRILLNALMQGDGHWYRNRPGAGVYTTISRRLADDVQRLAIECGRMAIVSTRDGAQAHHYKRYSVVIGNSGRASISLRKSRHVSPEQYSGKVYCLTVPTGAYFVRRNGKPGIYGNSQHWWNKPDVCITVWRDFEKLDSQDVDIYVQKVRFKHIGRPGFVTLKYGRITGRYSVPPPKMKSVGDA